MFGRIYRADTGEPLADAVVTAQSTESPFAHWLERSALDGSYSFNGIPAGSYFVGGYREGFVGKFYRIEQVDGSERPLTVRAGGEQSGINLRLDPAPRIMEIPNDSLTRAYPDKRLRIDFSMARFSPDGTLLAVAIVGVTMGDPEQVWLYEIASRRFIPVTENPQLGRRPHIRSLAWDNDGTLYVKGFRGGSSVPAYLVAATMTKSQEVDRIPARVAAIFDEEDVVSGKAALFFRESSQFIVTAEKLYGDIHLSAQRKGGATFEIARGNNPAGTFIFDADRSRVVYPKFVWPFATVISIDLTNRQSRDLASLQSAANVRLLDQTQNGTMIAYTVFGSCEPDESQNQWVLLRIKPLLPESPPPQMCLLCCRRT